MIYSTNVDTIRDIWLAPVSDMNSVTVNYEQENFDSVDFKYAYSYDEVNFTEWYDSSSEMIQHYKIENIPHQYVYVKVRFETKRTQNYQVLSSFELNEILIDSNVITVTGIEQIKETDRILQNNITKNLYAPYHNLDNAHELNKKLSYSVSKIFGHKCTYFKSEPDIDGRDVTFKSYRMSHVVDMKEIEIVINNNDLPDNRYQYSEFDTDFFDQIEIHIVIERFQEVFGDLSPNADDYLYLPLTGRMYQVNTVNEVKQFMHKSTYYQAILTKWEDRDDVDDTLVADKLPDFSDFVDNIDSEKYEEELVDATKDFNKESDEYPIIEDTLDESKSMDYMFKLTSYDNSETPMSYEFTALNNEFSIGLWIKSDYPTSQELFKLIGSDDLIALRCYINSYGNLVVDYSNNTTEIMELVANGSPLESDKKYAIFVNYMNNERGKYLTVTVLTDEYETLQENIMTDFDRIIETKSLNIHGGIYVGNIRVKKQFVSKSKIESVMTDLLPDTSDYYVLQNATPILTGDKLNVK